VTTDGTAVLDALDRLDPDRKGAGYTRTRELARLSNRRMTCAVTALVEDSHVEELEVDVVAGKGAKRKGRGLRRVNHQDTRTDPSG
jgi:hypothetical protein